MTREEQIKAAANKITGLFSYRNGYSTAEDAFIAGARWADANPCTPDKVVKIPERSREEIKELLDNWKGTLVVGDDISLFPSPWISVEERLPEMRSNNNPFSEQVYVRYVQTISGKNRIFYAFDKLQYICLSSGKIIGHVWWRHQNEYDRVTHWMEIPKIEEDIV